MRIIGGHDYYDSAQAYGHDPKIVFVRGSDTLPEDEFDRSFCDVYFVPPDKIGKQIHWKYRHESISTRSGRWYFYNVRVIFCGVLYNGLRATYVDSFGCDKNNSQVFWDRDEFIKWASDEFKDLVPIFQDLDVWRLRNNAIMTSNRLTGDEHSKLLKHRISIAIYDALNKVWKINCTGLKEVDFYRVFDAVTAFQELDMWMSGALGMPGNPMVEVSNDIRLAKHGMDKWSFRKKVR